MNYLKPLLAEYRYGKFGMLERDFVIHLDPQKEEGRIGNFVHIGPEVRSGNCCELTHSLEMRLKIEFSDLQVQPFWGNDPNYFTTVVQMPNGQTRGTHNFLLASEKYPLREAAPADFAKEDFLKTIDAYVVDPSFQLIVPYSESGYNLGAMDLGEYSPGYRDWNIKHGGSSVLGMDAFGDIVSLQVDFSHPQGLLILFGNRKNSRLFTLGDPFLRNLLGENKDLLKIIEKIERNNPLRNKPQRWSFDPLLFGEL